MACDLEDAQLLAGSGTGQDLHGLAVQATAYDTRLNASGDTRLDKLNHAINQLETAKYVVLFYSNSR